MDYREVLPQNTILDGKYRIDRVLGAGGFGITYEAVDIGLDMPVAIKEYYPTEFALRDQTRTVRPRSERHKQLFDHLRSSFLREAQTLAQFDDPAIVRVLSVFRANGTAYMVMRYEVGPSMKAWLAQLGRAPTQRELDTILLSLLRALSVMHKRDFLHRDIATDNIILRTDGSPVLLDFGSSRRVVAEATGTLTGIVKQGFSPPEQYSADSKVQGPWTDIYALGATLYRCITGSMPPEATARTLDDQLVPSRDAATGAYRPEFLDAIDWSLAVMPKQRPQTVGAWREALFAGTGFEQAQFTSPSHPISSELVGSARGPSDGIASRPSGRPSAPRLSGSARPSTPSSPSLAQASPSRPRAAEEIRVTGGTDASLDGPGDAAPVQLAGSSASDANWKRFVPIGGAAAILLLVGSMMLFAVPRQPSGPGANQPPVGAPGEIAPGSGRAARLPSDTTTVALAEPAKRLIDEQARQREATEQRQRDLDAQRRRAAEETERQRNAALEQNRRRDAEEAERQRIDEEARQRAAELAERQRVALLDETRRAAAAEAERLRLAEEARRRAAEEAERKRIDEENRQRAAVEEAERLRLAEQQRQRAAAEAAERTRIAEEQRQRALAEAAERERIAEESRQRAAAEEAERKRLAAEARRRAIVLNASQTVEFGRQLQQKLVEHNCYAGAITGREPETRIGLDMLQRHQAEVPALKLARATTGEAEDFLKWLDGLNKPICPPGPALEEQQRRNEEAARLKELDEQRARARQEDKSRQDAEQAREREEERQKKAEQRRAQQQREAAAERERDRERAQQRRSNNSGSGSGGGSPARSSSGGSGPSVRIPSF